MDVLLDEIESLEAILMDDVTITKNLETGFPELIETTVFPTVGEDTDRQYICVTLQVKPLMGYPDVSPEFQLQKPRGLDDKRLNEIRDACRKKITESIGYPVVFDLIDVIREYLISYSNLPSGQCVICLYGFLDGDEFTKTECYHYLHSYCLARHLTASKKNFQEEQEKLPAWQRKLSKPFQASCPVCREPINDDVGHIKNANPPKDLERAPDFHLTEELRDLQSRMAHLYLRQKSHGGIIDLEAEDSNVIFLEPDEHANDEGKDVGETIDEVGNENNSNISLPPQPLRQTVRPNHHHHHHHRGTNRPSNHTNMNNTPVNPSSQRNSNVQSTNHNFSHHHHQNRRHYNRGRRYHYNNGHQQSQDTSSQAAQKTTNINDPCGSNSR